MSVHGGERNYDFIDLLEIVQKMYPEWYIQEINTLQVVGVYGKIPYWKIMN